MAKAVVKEVDPYGRITLPEKWRKGLKEVMVVEFKDRLMIIPKNYDTFYSLVKLFKIPSPYLFQIIPRFLQSLL